MASASKLCSACLGALRSSLEDVEKSLFKNSTHHVSFVDFREAVARECFICAKLWDSISDESLAGCSKDPGSWKPLRCWIERRPWAPERYGAIYWHIRYLVFETGLLHLKYRGNVFCLHPIRNESEPSTLESTLPNFESNTSSVKVHEQAYDWYKTCRESHETCRRLSSRSGFTPSRLMDIGADGDKNWRLCLYQDDIADGDLPDYFTLSYRWAQKPTIALLDSTIDSFRRGAPIEDLPRTFGEAITVARRFSVRYLWIDSLCIVQDSLDDWARESLQMHDIYARSSCNIAASASGGPDGGLFRSRLGKDALIGYVKIKFPGNNTFRKFEIWDQFYMDRLTQGPLTNRGWVFQERVLSPRVLQFTQSQIVWECFQMSKCEMFPKWSPYPTEVKFSRDLKTVYSLFEPGSSTSLSAQESKAMSEDVYEQWKHLVETYSRCALTCADDRLIAMFGVAEMYKQHTGDEFLAGLWKSRLTESLNWVVLSPVARPKNRFRAPSWSWAAVDSAVLPQPINLPRDDDLVEIVSTAVETPITSAGWKRVIGSIQLRGCLSCTTIQESRARSSSGENVTVKLVELPSRLFAYPDTTNIAFEDGKKLYLLPLRSTLRRLTTQEGTEAERLIGTPLIILEGLILEPVSEGGNSYQRVGRFVVDSLDHITFFGLLAIPPYPGGGPTKVIVDDKKTSLITLL